MKKSFLVLSAISLLSNCNTSTPITTTPNPSATAVVPSTKYTLAQIAPHSTAADCWFAVSGKVYNVTSFIASGQHPGGNQILLGCGKDATSLFENQPGEGTPHSPQSHEMLQNYYIGDLAQ